MNGFVFCWDSLPLNFQCLRPEGQAHPLPGPSGPGNGSAMQLRPEWPTQSVALLPVRRPVVSAFQASDCPDILNRGLTAPALDVSALRA